MPIKVRPHLKNAVADKKVTTEEWENEIKPNLSGRPKASTESRAVLRAWGNDAFEIEDGARSGMERYLRQSGYAIPWDVGRPDRQTVREVLASNVSEKDQGFERLIALTGRRDARTTIAVLDGGFELGHPALESKWWTNPGEVADNGLDDDGNGLVDDVNGWDFVDGDNDLRGGSHGTHVSGIATRGTERIVNIPVRTFSPLTAEKLREALEYACANGAKVVNMSFKMDEPDEVEAALAVMAKYPEVLFVKSAGNDGERLDPSYGPYAPQTYLPTNVTDNLVVVASCDASGNRAASSNYGAPFATVGARGHDVFSTVPGRTFEPMDGTSMAAPNVVAVAARCLALAPRLTASELRRMLVETTETRADWRDLTASGGLVDEERMLQLAALVSLTDGGLEPQVAADRLGLRGEERARLLALLPGYLPAAGSPQPA